MDLSEQCGCGYDFPSLLFMIAKGAAGVAEAVEVCPLGFQPERLSRKEALGSKLLYKWYKK